MTTTLLSKEDHQHIINKFYEAGYITAFEKEKLLKYLDKASAYNPLDILVKGETRYLHYRYRYSIFNANIFLDVFDDFSIIYNFDTDAFTLFTNGEKTTK